MKAKNSTILIALCAIMMLAAYNFDLLTRQVCYDSGITTRLGLSATDRLFFRTQKYLVARSLETGVRFFIEPDYRRLNDEMNTYMKDYADLAAYFAASARSFEKINEFIGNEQFLPSDFYFPTITRWRRPSGISA